MDTTGELGLEIEKFLEGAVAPDGWGATIADIVNMLLDVDVVYSEIGRKHRWYDEKTVVVKIDGRLIGYDWYHLTGDNNASDMGLEFDLSSVAFYEEYQVTVTKYRKVLPTENSNNKEQE